MKRKDMKVGMKVIPSGKGYTKHWNLGDPTTGEIVNLDHPRYVYVKWRGDDRGRPMLPLHLEPENKV